MLFLQPFLCLQGISLLEAENVKLPCSQSKNLEQLFGKRCKVWVWGSARSNPGFIHTRDVLSLSPGTAVRLHFSDIFHMENGFNIYVIR